MEQKNREEKSRREKIREGKNLRRKKMQMREKVGKSRKHCVFSNDLGLRRVEKVGSLKRAGAEPAGQMRDEKIARRCGAKHISKSKCTKQHQVADHFLAVEMSKKVHAVVARSTFRSQNVQSTSA